MKKCEGNSYPKGKNYFLMIVSFVGILLFLQFVGLSRISFSLEILNINTASSKETVSNVNKTAHTLTKAPARGCKN